MPPATMRRQGPQGATDVTASQTRRDVREDRLDDVGVVVDAKLVGHGEQQRVGLGDRFVFLELLDQHIGLGGVAAAENRPRVVAQEADLVFALAAAAK